MKEARDEAKKEIDEYRANKEAEFKEFEAKVRTLAFFLLCYDLPATDTE